MCYGPIWYRLYLLKNSKTSSNQSAIHTSWNSGWPCLLPAPPGASLIELTDVVSGRRLCQHPMFFPRGLPWVLEMGIESLTLVAPAFFFSSHPLTWWKRLSSLNLQWFLSYHHHPQLLNPVLRKGFVISHLHVCMNKHQINNLISLRTICIFSEQKALCRPPHSLLPKVLLVTESRWDLLKSSNRCLQPSLTLSSTHTVLPRHFFSTSIPFTNVQSLPSAMAEMFLASFHTFIHSTIFSWGSTVF